MTPTRRPNHHPLSRRRLLATAASTPIFAGCSRFSLSRGDDQLKFWNMPWGETEFTSLDRQITHGYEPKTETPPVTYQVIQWANFLQTFTSAVASHTGPAVSSGGGTLAFQFEEQGAIEYADHLLDEWRRDGLADDFLPGLLDTMKVPNGYAAIPYNLDMRVVWYNKSLLDEAGAQSPTDWQSYLDAAEALKKIDVYGYGTGAGAGSYTASHALVCWMINNGGGLFDEDQLPNCVTPENIEAMEFVLEMVHKGYVDPRSITYTSANVQSQWEARTFGMGIDGGGLADEVTGDVKDELVVNEPLTGPSGEKGSLYFPNNIMMYKNTPSQRGSEEFLTYYYHHMAPLWTRKTGIGLPPLKSITDTEEFRANENNVTIVEEWQPIARTWAAPGGDALFANVAVVDGTPTMDTFTQTILTGRSDAKTALRELQRDITANVRS